MRQKMMACVVFFLPIVMLSEWGRRVEPPPRRVYVLHGGVHFVLSKAGKNGAAERLREELAQRGIAERDLIVLDNPFPTASWSDILPRASLPMFLSSADPASPVAQSAYRRLDAALRAHAVTPQDEIVWVGHSAGGQMGMTLAHLAHRLHAYPDLLHQAQPYRFALVVTLGTPVIANHVPPEVRLRHYCSAADTVVRLLAGNSDLVAKSLGAGVRFAPYADLGPNVKVRVFQGIRHHQWCGTERVIDAIVNETRPDGRPSWRRGQGEEGRGVGLAQLLADALEKAGRISFEE